MEKLILKSVMYGADKIPDKWFEKVPGGFFREKEASKRNTDSPSSDRQKNASNRRSTHDQHNDHYDDDGYRSEGHRQRHNRSRSSLDGPVDDDDYYPSDGERRRPRSGKSHRRRHSTEGDGRGHDDRHHRNQRRSGQPTYDPAFNPYRRPDLRSPDLNYDRERPSSGAGSDRSSKRFSLGSSAAAAHPPYQRSSATESPAMQSPTFSQAAPPCNGSMNNGYVPYANIYGPTQQSPLQQQFSPPPASSTRGPQPYPDDRNSPPVAPPPQGYHQNPFAQQAPTAADAGAGGAYTGNAGVMNQGQDPRWNNGPDPYYSARLYTQYDENDAPNPNSTSPRRSSRRDYSLSHDSYDTLTQATHDRRSRSERRPDHKSNTRGKSKSRVREAFDTSERGLGYGAVGAVTGGLIGSEFGKGAIPAAIGATVGALGANAFEAREKRKEGRRDSEYQRDGTYARGDMRRRRSEGYYSD